MKIILECSKINHRKKERRKSQFWGHFYMYNTMSINTMSIKAYINNTEGNEKLGEYFKVKEFACKDKSPVTFVDEYLVTLLNILRTKIGKPIIITSGYRTPEHNAKVGGAKYSYHMRGMAADIRVDGMTAKQLAKELDKMVPNACGIIVYSGWVHFDTRNSKYRKGV